MEPFATAQDAAQPFSAQDASQLLASVRVVSRPFETARLLLRPLVMADLDDLFALYSQPELMRYITGRPRSYHETKERLEAHIADYERYGFGLCAAILRATGQMIGRCGLEPIQGKMGIEGTIAWMFKEEYWGQGLATEFGQALVSHGLEEFGLMRIFATADHRNLASIAVMRRIGMRSVRSTGRGVEYEICRREHVHRPGALPT